LPGLSAKQGTKKRAHPKASAQKHELFGKYAESGTNSQNHVDTKNTVIPIWITVFPVDGL
jgi:hypothetical protein